MKFVKRTFPIIVLAVLSADLANAQKIVGLSMDLPQIKSRAPVRLAVEFTANYPVWCGLQITWGDGETRDIRIGDDSFKSSPALIEHVYSGHGTTYVAVKGKFMQRGLKSARACEVVVEPIPVEIIP